MLCLEVLCWFTATLCATEYLCADVPLRNYSLTHSLTEDLSWWPTVFLQCFDCQLVIQFVKTGPKWPENCSVLQCILKTCSSFGTCYRQHVHMKNEWKSSTSKLHTCQCAAELCHVCDFLRFFLRKNVRVFITRIFSKFLYWKVRQHCDLYGRTPNLLCGVLRYSQWWHAWRRTWRSLMCWQVHFTGQASTLYTRDWLGLHGIHLGAWGLLIMHC